MFGNGQCRSSQRPNGSGAESTSGINYCTIQQAVNAASPNDVISADAGVYNESIITINKPLTLNGANAGISAGKYPGVRGAESVINGYIKTSAVVVFVHWTDLPYNQRPTVPVH